MSIALLLRIALVLHALRQFGPAWFFTRGSEMGFLAASLLHGHGLGSPFGVDTGPTAMVAPGYPLLVAAVFRVLGSYTWAAALCLMLLHVGCNTVTVYLVYCLGRKFSQERAAGTVALFWACSPPLLWMPTIFWETNLSSLLTLGMVSVLLHFRSPRSLGFWFSCGIVCGVTGLINPALLPSFFALTLYNLLCGLPNMHRALHVAAAVAGLMVVFVPWPVRNYYVFHTLVLTRTTVGLELWMGNRLGSRGFLDPTLFPSENPAELAAYRSEGEIAYTAKKGELARAYIIAHPARFLWLSGQRWLRFWTGTGTEHGSALFSVHALVSSWLGLGGVVLLWRGGFRRECLSAAIVLLLFPLPYYVTHAEFRYRLVVDPLLAALAAPALQWLLLRLSPVQDHLRFEQPCQTQTDDNPEAVHTLPV